MDSPDIYQQIKKWQDSLADSKISNPLLNWKQPKGKPRFLSINKSASEIFSRFVGSESGIFTLAELEISEEQVAEFYSTAKETLQEKGVNTLFVVVGSIDWANPEQSNRSRPSFFNAPLLLLPVELLKGHPRRRRVESLQTLDGEVFFNPLLTKKLDEFFNIQLPDSEAIQSWSYEKFINEISQAIGQNERVRFEPETVRIALFEDLKAAMIRDLQENQSKIANHPILQGLAGDTSRYRSQPSGDLNQLDLDQLDPRRLFQILDADSSQQFVIEKAKAGQSFVVQGPPGTGKSQTITNIVAELVGQGKHVLLVSEKKTALEVVADRNFAKHGLENLCLKLYHGGTTKKKDLVQDLKNTAIALQQEIGSQPLDLLFADLKRYRDILNVHVDQLHSKHPLINQSIFSLYGEIRQLEHNGVLIDEFHLDDVSEWSVQRVERTKELLRKLSRYPEIFQGQKTTVWNSACVQAWSSEVNNKLRGGIESLNQAIRQVEELIGKIGQLSGKQVSATGSLKELNQLRNTLAHIEQVPESIRDWSFTADADQLENYLKMFENTYEKLETGTIWSKYDRQILHELKISQFLERFKKYQGWRKFLLRRYWQDRKHVLSYRTGGIWVLDRKLVAEMEQLSSLQALQVELSEPWYAARISFKELYNTQNPNFEEIRQGVRWLFRLQQINWLSAKQVERIVRAEHSRQQISTLVQDASSAEQKLQTGFRFLREYISANVLETNQSLEDRSIADIKQLLEDAQADLVVLRDTVDCRQLEREIVALGAKNFLFHLRDSKLPSELWFDAFKKGVYQNWLQHLLSNYADLRGFRRTQHEQAIARFCEADKWQQEFARARLKQLHAERWQAWKTQNDPAIQKQLQLFESEGGKSRGHKAIRQFVTSAKDLVRVLKPCWFMTPLAVSEYIDPEAIQFDTVIFDEASQLQTADAVPAIMRATQVIVVGDREQLPPTNSLFKGTTSEEEEEEEGSYESLLDACYFMNPISLQWHYRSQDESLIAFSANQFYKMSNLVYFPSPIRDEHRGVHFEYVENGGFDQKKGNPAEAKKVAELVQHHLPYLKAHKLSLGIIAFGQSQVQTIRQELQKLGKNDPELDKFCQGESEQFFLKSLELVQGNEADVILISFGYGRTAEGKPSFNFGPLTRRDGVGRRRLNVAITRARWKLVLVASVNAVDLSLTSIVNEELEILREYFAYAADSDHSLDRSKADAKRQMPLEEDIYQALIKQGYIVEKQIGQSQFPISLAIKAREGDKAFLLGIECDGNDYSQYKTARDRDRLRRTVLEENLKWNIYRIWTCDWYNRRNEELNRLLQHIERLRRNS